LSLKIRGLIKLTMKLTGERCIIGQMDKVTEKEHIDRYNFARKYATDKVVLDIACGSGYGSKILSQKAKNVMGVDVSKKSVDYANKNFNSKNTKFFWGNATDLGFIKEHSIDLVVSFETIEHLKNYERFLQEIKRVLKKEGILIISTPNKKFSSPKSERPINPYHVIEFYYEGFNKLLRNCFDNVQFYGQTYIDFIKYLKSKLISLFPRSLRRLLIPQKIRDSYNLRETGSISDKNVERCKYFIAICKTNKK
jgi:ubiquinone/menaquinone biosynthesis C-methylase UbiE